MRHVVLAAALIGLATLSCAGAQTAASAPSFVPFAIPWDDATPGTATDVSFLNAAPAGSNGFIVVKDSHFVESKTGRRIRFLGTNFAFKADFPDHEDAGKVAAHLAKLGINIVRIHHHDADWGDLWDKSSHGHTQFDPVAIDKLDYLIAQLEKHGIYVDLNLHVSRQFTAADGFPPSVSELPGDFDKRIDNLDRRMIDLQKQFAHDYLTRVNPYTGRSYVNDPGVALIEINNENSLVAPDNDDISYFDTLPEPFRSEVVRDWNAWLARNYHSTEQLRQVWTPVSVNASSPPVDLLTSASKWQLEDRAGDVTLTKTDSGSDTAAASIEVVNPAVSDPAWYKQVHIAGLDLVEGQLYTLTLRAKADSERAIPFYAGLDEDDWHHVGLDSDLKVGTYWRTFHFTFQATNTTPDHSRLSFQLGQSAGTLDIADLSLTTASGDDILPKSQSIEAHNIDLPSMTSMPQRTDWRRFLVDTEDDYVNEMRVYLRKTLKIHANIVDSQMSYGGLSGFRREEESDFADVHAYWHHPAFPGKAWDPKDWRIANSPMTDALASGSGGEFAHMAAYRVAGKPYTCTEYNEPAPNDFEAEMYPELATYAASQDWDAIFEFDFGNYGTAIANNKIQGFFALQGNPAKEAFVPAAALIFRGGEFAPAANKLTVHMVEQAAYATGDATAEWRKVNGGKVPDLLANRFESTLDPHTSACHIERSVAKDHSSSIQAVTTTSGSQYLAQGQSAVSAAGYVGGTRVNLGPATFDFPTFGNNFAALTLTARDFKPVGNSSSLLITIIGKVANPGMQWNADRTSVADQWGDGPAEAEAIPASVTVANTFVKHVWALGTTGERIAEVPSTSDGGKLTFTVGPQYGTVWYELAP